jgi:hypothetical protein
VAAILQKPAEINMITETYSKNKVNAIVPQVNFSHTLEMANVNHILHIQNYFWFTNSTGLPHQHYHWIPCLMIVHF